MAWPRISTKLKCKSVLASNLYITVPEQYSATPKLDTNEFPCYMIFRNLLTIATTSLPGDLN